MSALDLIRQLDEVHEKYELKYIELKLYGIIGRGKNSWISHLGALQFSFIVRHHVNYKHAPVVFIQYIIALAIVESIRERPGYESIPLRLKWPNDIYVECKNGELKKVGGTLMNSSFTSDEFVLVIGITIAIFCFYVILTRIYRMWTESFKYASNSIYQ